MSGNGEPAFSVLEDVEYREIMNYQIDESSSFSNLQKELINSSSPEHSLLGAIVFRALQDLSCTDRDIRRNAKIYFTKEFKITHWGDFAYCCHILDIRNHGAFIAFAKQVTCKLMHNRFGRIDVYNKEGKRVASGAP